MQPSTLYEQDEHAWIEQQIALMRAGKMEQLDGRNLVLFLSDMMIRDRRELRSRLTNLFVYLLKIQYLSEKVTVRTISGIIEQQHEINTLLASVPSLQEHVPGLFEAAFRDALRHVKVETGAAPRRLPTRSPWCLEDAVEFTPPEVGAVLRPEPIPVIEKAPVERPPPKPRVPRETKPRVPIPDEAIAKVIAGEKVRIVARDYGIPRQTLADRVKRALTPSELPAAKPDADPVDNANGEERGGCD